MVVKTEIQLSLTRSCALDGIRMSVIILNFRNPSMRRVSPLSGSSPGATWGGKIVPSQSLVVRISDYVIKLTVCWPHLSLRFPINLLFVKGEKCYERGKC